MIERKSPYKVTIFKNEFLLKFYKDYTANQVAIGVAAGTLDIGKPLLFPELGDLIISCMTREVLQRPKFLEICQRLESQE
jgi:hypothetical protein